MDLLQEMITKTINYVLACSVRFYNHSRSVARVLFISSLILEFL